MDPTLAAAISSLGAVIGDLRWTDGIASVTPPVEADYRRILRERRSARGWDEAAIGQALGNPAMRAVARLLRGDAAAVLLLAPPEQTAVARTLLESEPGCQMATVRCGAATQGGTAGAVEWGELAFALLEDDGAPAAATAGALASTGLWLTRRLGRTFVPLVVAFSGGRDIHRQRREAALAALQARGGVELLQLYSPLFHAGGRLDTEAILQRIAAAVPSPRIPLLWIPGLPWNEWEAGLASPLSARLLAGAERPLAWADSSPSAPSLSLTLRLLDRLRSPA